MLDVLKGMVVAAACLIGFSLQFALGFEEHVDLAVGLVVIGLPIGTVLGGIAGALRSDRVLAIIATAFVFVLVILLFGSATGRDYWDWNLEVYSTYPWILIGALVLSKWIPPLPTLTVPAARVGGHRALRLRPLTAMEISTLLWVLSAVVIAFGADIHPRSEADYDEQAGSKIPTVISIGALLVTLAIPFGVAVGAVARELPRLRLLLLLIVSFVAAGYGAILMPELGPIELPGWAPLVILVATIAIERLTRDPRASTGTV